MMRLLDKIKGFLHDPLGLREIHKSFSSVSKDLVSLRQENKKSFEEVIADYREYAKEQKEKAHFYSMSLENIGNVIPDMLWMKWADGKYAYANKAIKEGLLFDNCPLGKNDATIGDTAVKRFGENNHNFGRYCSGSDLIVLEYGHRKRFIEYGMSGGKPLVLEVYKNVVRDEDGEIIATVGSGRDITDNIFTMLRLGETCGGTCQTASSPVLEEYLDKYLFVNELSDKSLNDFYRETKDLYYE